METDMMTPYNRRWNVFINRLTEECGGHWLRKCDTDPKRPKARMILREMGFAPDAIEQSMGFCDCEIVCNVDDSAPKPKRRRR